MSRINSIALKSSLAQKLLERKEIEIDGVVLKLWQGHSRDSVNMQNTWNRIKSYASLNKDTQGENGVVVFSGVMQIPRIEAAKYAVQLGFRVRNNISRKTDFIIVGSENVSPSKVAKAIEFNEKGADIHFVDELTFLQMVEDNLDLISPEQELKIDTGIIEETKPKAKSKSEQRVESKSDILSISIAKPSPDLLQGKAFVVSGKFSIARDELKKLISKYGGRNVSSISSKTDYVLAGEAMGPAKLKKAESLGIPIISEEDFMEMIGLS